MQSAVHRGNTEETDWSFCQALLFLLFGGFLLGGEIDITLMTSLFVVLCGDTGIRQIKKSEQIYTLEALHNHEINIMFLQ